MKDVNINDLINKVDIVDIISNFAKLVKTGSSFKTLCNIHGDNSPSLSINPKKQIYKCFVCDHGGNALDYLMWAQKMTWNEAIEFLIKQSGENIEDFSFLINKKKYSEYELKMLKAMKDASDLFNYYLNIEIDNSKDSQINKFIEKRKITKSVIEKFKLGFAPSFDEKDNFISNLEKKGHEKSVLINCSILNEEGTNPFYINKFIFPIFDEDNNVIGFSGRKIVDNDDSPKYLNSKESHIFKKSNVIYNYNNAKKYDQIIIVEGFMDVIAFSKIGKDNAIALMGVALSQDNLNKIKKHQEILIFLDSDKAGIMSTLKIVKIFIEKNINAFVLKNEYLKDPDEILNSDGGEQKLLSSLNNKIKMIDFVFEAFTKNVNQNDFEKLKEIIMNIYQYSKNFNDFLKLELIDKISKKFNLNKDVVSNYFNYKPNVIELKELDKKNIKTKQTLELELEQPLNINKLLISIWKNPSFLKSMNIGDINWPKAEYKKIYEEIKKFHLEGIEVSEKTKTFVLDKEKKFKSKESLPKNMESFEELILRTHKDSKRVKIEYINELIKKTNDPKHKEELLRQKLEIISRKE